MAKKGAIIRIPFEAKEGLIRKQDMISNMIRNLTKKQNLKLIQ